MENSIAILGMIVVMLQILRELLGIYKDTDDEDPDDR